MRLWNRRVSPVLKVVEQAGLTHQWLRLWNRRVSPVVEVVGNRRVSPVV